MVIDGRVVLDNIEFTPLEHHPVARLRVLNEFTLPPLDHTGRTLLSKPPLSHLNPVRYQYPGFKSYWHFILTAETNPVAFVVDMSRSTDADGDLLTFQWSYYVGGDEGDFYPLAGGVASQSPFFTNQPPFLNNSTSRQLYVQVQDDYVSSAIWFGVRVITPQDAMSRMWDWLDNEVGHPRRIIERHFIPTLQRAEADFAAGRTEAARRGLQKFQSQVKGVFRKVDPVRAQTLLVFSQRFWK